jgi:hypothetical protein
MSNYVSDCTLMGDVSYRCQRQDGVIKAVASVRETVARRGAYLPSITAFTTSGRPLGSKQQMVAAVLKREAQRDLTAALIAAGWRTEMIQDCGREQLIWWPPITK